MLFVFYEVTLRDGFNQSVTFHEYKTSAASAGLPLQRVNKDEEIFIRFTKLQAVNENETYV